MIRTAEAAEAQRREPLRIGPGEKPAALDILKVDLGKTIVRQPWGARQRKRCVFSGLQMWARSGRNRSSFPAEGGWRIFPLRKQCVTPSTHALKIRVSLVRFRSRAPFSLRYQGFMEIEKIGCM